MKYSQQKNLIAEFLRTWFKNNSNNKYLWSKDVIGIVIKEELIKTDNWTKRASKPPKPPKPSLFDILEKSQKID